MKTKGLIVFVVIVLVIFLSAIFLVPNIFPKDNVTSLISQESNFTQKVYTLEEMIQNSEMVLLGTVIKVDADENGALYTMHVKSKEVFKGKNYSTMGYAYVRGPKSLEMSEKYLFIGNEGSEKHHYFEPFNVAPWVFKINKDQTLTHISNGDKRLLKSIDELTLNSVKDICKKIDK